MYRQLARWFQEQALAATAGGASSADLQTAALRVFDAHPLQLSRFLEEAWFMRTDAAGRPSGALPPVLMQQQQSGFASELDKVTTDIYPLDFGSGGDPTPVGRRAQWNHLIYAYMIENTRIFEIMQRVLHEYLSGETLEVPSAATHRWLRATEDLLYRDQPSSELAAVTSWTRPDIRAEQRILYYLFFGLDLNHGTIDNRPYPFEKPKASNRDFVRVFEEFLREIDTGIKNSINTSGVNATDDAAIANLANQLYDMLRARRRNGNWSREEYIFVSKASWFHLTVEFDSPLVRDLKAEAPSPEERLRKIGERVGLPAHAKSESYLILAETMSRLLIEIEMGLFNSPANARALYAPPTPTVPNPLREDAMSIITHWSIATGRDLKAGKVTISPRTQAESTGRAPTTRIAAPLA